MKHPKKQTRSRLDIALERLEFFVQGISYAAEDGDRDKMAGRIAAAERELGVIRSVVN